MRRRDTKARRFEQCLELLGRLEDEDRFCLLAGQLLAFLRDAVYYSMARRLVMACQEHTGGAVPADDELVAALGELRDRLSLVLGEGDGRLRLRKTADGPILDLLAEEPEGSEPGP